MEEKAKINRLNRSVCWVTPISHKRDPHHRPQRGHHQKFYLIPSYGFISTLN